MSPSDALPTFEVGEDDDGDDGVDVREVRRSNNFVRDFRSSTILLAAIARPPPPRKPSTDNAAARNNTAVRTRTRLPDDIRVDVVGEENTNRVQFVSLAGNPFLSGHKEISQKKNPVTRPIKYHDGSAILIALVAVVVDLPFF